METKTIDSGHDPPFHPNATINSWDDMWPLFPNNEYLVFNLESELGATVGIDRPCEVDTTFLFDTAAGTSVVKNLDCCILESFIPCSKESLKITGIGGSNIEVLGSVRLRGPFSYIRAWYAPGAIANIIASVDVQTKLYTQFRDQNTLYDRIECSIDKPGLVITGRVEASFKKDKRNGFYKYTYYSTNGMADTYACSSINSFEVFNVFTDAHVLGLSRDTIKTAMKVEALHRSLSYVSLDRLADIVRNQQYGFGIKPSDVDTYKKYLHARRCIACALGKALEPSAVPSERPKATAVGERVIADIFFIKSTILKEAIAYLIAIDEFSGHIHCRPLASRHLDNVKSVFIEIIDDYSRHGHVVQLIRIDREGSFDALPSYLSGVIFEPCIPGRHARVAERAIRTICSLFRCTLAGLSFVLAPHLYGRLIEYVVSSNNLVTNSHNSVKSAHELFFRTSPDYARYLNMTFGDLVVYHNPTDNTDEDRGIAGLIVGRSLDTPGGALIWDIYNGCSVVRIGYKKVDWTQAITDMYIDKSSQGTNSDHRKWLDKRSPFYTPADIDIAEEEIDGLIGAEVVANTEMQSDPPTLEQDDLDKLAMDLGMSTTSHKEAAEKESRLRMGNQISNHIPEELIIGVDDLHIGKVQTSNKRSNTANTKIMLFPGYENIMPTRTRSGKVLHMSISESKKLFPKEDVQKALAAELSQMFQKHVWLALDKEAIKKGYKEGSIKNIITSSIFLKDKYDAGNKFIKLKARLVAHGNRQIIDEIFGSKSVDSPTASLASIFILLHLAASNGWRKTVVDVGGAYLNGDLKDPEFMRLSKDVVDLLDGTESAFPVELKQEDGSVVVKLLKALYGLKQSGRIWYDLLTKTLEQLGYVRSEIDRCLFSKVTGATMTHIAVYVDDLLIVGNDEPEKAMLVDCLKSTFKEITIQEGSDISFVGLEIHTDDNKNVCVRQLGYIQDILVHFNIKAGEFDDHPCASQIMDSPKIDELDADKAKFLSGIMKLMFLSTRSRPDIAFAVSALASRSCHPKESDMKAMNRIARYLNKTQEEFLIFKHGGKIDISAYVDASFMCHRDMRSHTGYAIFSDDIGSAGIVYRSVKQKTVANSSTEAEVIALHDLIQHLIWIQGIYDSLQVSYSKPSTIFDDSIPTIKLNSAPIVNFAGRSKYIARKYFSVYEHVENGEIILRWTGTDDMIADVLTKAIVGNKFRKFKIALLGHTDDFKVSNFHSE